MLVAPKSALHREPVMLPGTVATSGEDGYSNRASFLGGPSAAWRSTTEAFGTGKAGIGKAGRLGVEHFGKTGIGSPSGTMGFADASAGDELFAGTALVPSQIAKKSSTLCGKTDAFAR